MQISGRELPLYETINPLIGFACGLGYGFSMEKIGFNYYTSPDLADLITVSDMGASICPTIWRGVAEVVIDQKNLAVIAFSAMASTPFSATGVGLGRILAHYF